MKAFEIIISHFNRVHRFLINARNEQEAVDVAIEAMTDKTCCKIEQIIELP